MVDFSMCYEIRYIKREPGQPDELTAFEELPEHPSEDYLNEMTRATKSTFADVSRKEETE